MTIACEYHSWEVLRLLLETGADIEAKPNLFSNTALIDAVGRADGELISHLLQLGADIDAKGHNGTTPLMTAIQRRRYAGVRDIARYLEAIEMLLARGAAINIASEDGDTALIIAARIGDYLAVKLLLKRGAEVNARNKKGWTPLMEAAAGYASPIYDPALDGLIYVHNEICKLLLDAGANVNARDNSGYTVLMHANGNAIKLLFDKGADINAMQDERGITALGLARHSGASLKAKLLSELGAAPGSNVGKVWEKDSSWTK